MCDPAFDEVETVHFALPELPGESPARGPALGLDEKPVHPAFFSFKRRPSAFLQERTLTTQDRLAKAAELAYVPNIIGLVDVGDLGANGKGFHVPADKTLFEPFPAEVVLQAYEPFKTYEISISFRNNDKFARTIRLEPIDGNRYFSLSGRENDSLKSPKIAPGMAVTFTLIFRPESISDYSYDIVCVTEREKFVVPVRCIGARAILDFPDEVSFSECPVCYTTIKTLLIRNVGNRFAKFEITTTEPFACEPKSGLLEVDENMQLDIVFNPKKTGSFRGEMTVVFDTKEEFIISLLGSAEDANIRLDKTTLTMDKTYMTLSSLKKFRIHNRSDIMTRFRWKQFPTIADESQHRFMRYHEIQMEEEREALELLSGVTNQVDAAGDLCLIEQRYRNQKREMEVDPLLFKDSVFDIETVEGVVWPNSFVEITVRFHPHCAGELQSTAYCEIEGRETRLPLMMKGEGIGPKAKFSYDILSIDSVFINSMHKYEVVLENKGSIEVSYRLLPPCTLFGPKFSFEPSSGVLGIGEYHPIIITFASDILGEFAEEFQWSLEGGLDPLSLILKGCVVGPTFSFNVADLNFGPLSMGFLSSRTIELSNTSHISMKFRLRFSQDDRFGEYRVSPNEGTLLPLESQPVRVALLPKSIKQYSNSLIVDVEGVGDDLLSLPILAEGLVPEISLKTLVLDYGDCFLNYTYTRSVELVNETDYSARYELSVQEEAAKNVYSYNSSNFKGIVGPHAMQQIQIEVQMRRLGQCNFPIFIKIHGREDMPLGVDITGNGIGPNVVLSTTELNWGKIQALRNSTSKLVLQNDSPIPASFTCATASELSVFRVEPLIGCIPPHGKDEVSVTAYLDDSLKFTDILRISVQSDGVHEVQLIARGNGPTITFDESLRTVDFGDVFSNRECTREFVLVNKGRRSQTLHWLVEEERFSRKDAANLQPPVFDISPSRFMLKPNAQQIVTIRGYSNKSVRVKETMVCQGIFDKDPTRKAIVETTIVANFVTPLVEVTPSSLKFVSSYIRDEDFEFLSQSLVLKNTTTLSLTLNLRCFPPYSIDQLEPVCLGPGETANLMVHYDPSYNTNRVSCKEHSKLLISYEEHPQRASVDLFSEVSFPNLTFSSTTVPFGCIPNDTEQKRIFSLTNSGLLPVSYYWSFLETKDERSSDFSLTPIRQVFDILPMSGVLQPGDSDNVEVTFYGHIPGQFSALALCDVSGGPKYEISLSGEVSQIAYQFDREYLDYGTVLYQDIHEQDIVLSNLGQVAFDYNTIIFRSSSLAQKITVSPSSGSIPPHGKQKITVRFCLTIPESVDDHFYVQIAYFEPIRIRISGVGVAPRILLNLPRVPDARYDTLVKEMREASKRALKRRPSVMPRDAGVTESNLSISTVRSDSHDTEIDAEAERLLLKEKTLDFMKGLVDEVKGKIQPVPKAKVIGSPILIYKIQQKGTKDKKAHSSLWECSQVRVARYLCDFGNVIRNTNKKKTIRITNHGERPVSFQLEKLNLSGTGFSIEPEKVKSLPGAPHYESVEFQVTFQARSQTTDLGHIEVDLPITVNGGPTTILVLRAEVTLPDVAISSNDILFGEVMCGLRKTITIQIRNITSVPAEWMVHTAEGDSGLGGAKKKQPPKKRVGQLVVDDFEILPCSGVLQPKEKALITLRFFPSQEKDYDISLPIKVSMNSKPSQIRLCGRGITPRIQFEPETMAMGPILPCSDGIESKFMVFNPTNYPLEIYTLNFDQQYIEEEDILRKLDGYVNGVIYLPPRIPGQPLPDYLIDLVGQKGKVEKGMIKESPGEVAVSPTPAAAVKTTGAGHEPGVGDIQLELGGGVPGRPAKVPADPDPPMNVLVHGPPFSGKTTQSKAISREFGQVYIRIDDIIEAHLAAESNYSDGSASLQRSKDAVKLEEERGLDRVSTRSFNVDESDRMSQAEYCEVVDPQQPVNISEENLLEIIRARLQREDCILQGIVVDGIESKFVGNPVTILKAIMRGLGERKKFVFFNVSLDVPHIREREMVENKAQGDKELAMLQVKDLTEEEYDAMSELEKEQYDTGLLKYKRRLKEIQDRRKVERRHWEEEVAQRMGERKVEEEAKPVKKKTARGARSTAGKSSDKSTGKSAKAGEKGGGGGSPKLARKTVSDRNDKGMPDKAEKSDRDRPDRLEKLEDENASRLTLSEYGDIFFAEQTSRRYEAYAAALEAMMVFIKEGDKPNAARAANGPGANDARKPTKAASKVPSTGAAISTQEPPPAGSTVFTDGELHVTEDGTQVSYQEVNGAMDEASLFKAMAEHIPKKEETAPPPEPVDVIPAPLVEQIVHFPGERDVHPLQQHFCLLPPVTAAEAEEEGAAQPDGSVSVVVPTIKTEPQAPGKKTRFTNKFAEDTRVPENEEETVVKDVQTKFRWIVQPKEKKELTIRFSSNETGKFEQTITFEIVGGRGKFSLHCVGFCQHSQINGDYRKIFSKFRKSKEEKAIVHGEFIASTSTFEFGPLLYSKPREKYLEKFPENRAILTITNATTNDIKIHFSLKHDVKSDVFFYEPAIMDLGPQQTLPFTLWAYPRSSNTFEDTLICCVRDNPEPYLFKVSCIGVKPELEIDKKFLSFDKILLGRTEKREIKLKNNTYMPVAWKLVGVDGLGDEFSAAPTEGIIDSFTESVVTAEFHGNKPVVVKRMIRLEVSDTEKIGGVVQEVPILVTAEAYDIAVDVHFPKGYEGGIDFGVLKVIPPKDPKDPKDPKALKDTAVSPPEDTVKLETKTWTLKNKGKYEVGYRIVYEKEEYKYMFPIAPSVGPLQPSDKPVSVTIGIRPSHEFTLKDIVIARYQFFEPSTLEVTATVPVKICARTVFSRFSVLPVQDLNFGALVFGIKGTRQFTIENMGEFDFKYGIYKIVQGMLDAKQGKRTNTSRMSKIVRPNSPPPTTKGPNRKEFSKMGDAANFGAFTVFPTNGTVAAGMKQQITVEFHSDTPGSFEEMIALDISDRPPTEDVIAYRLMGESCVPGINTYDLSSIFEEHTICKRLELFNSQGNIYAEEDRVFYFGAYLVFSQGQARFKIINPYKITCDVSLATKPRSKTKSDTADFAFDVDPKKLTIPSHEYRYVTVSFHPTLIQSYAGIFEAVVENVSESKSKILSFEIRGEGSLPRVVIEKPTTKSKLGAPLLKFRRILVGASQSQSILVRNEGILPATIKFEWGPKDSSDFECGSVNKTHTLRPQEMRSFELLFTPRSIRKVESDIRIRVIDNNFEDIVVQLAGEGYMDDLTFDNLGGESNQNELIMSDCHLNEIRTCSFLVGNNSNDVLRIIWPENTDFVFSPMVAHVRAKGSKEFGISFCPKQPCDYKAVQLACKSIKIRYTGATLESDWDDRSKAIKWTTDRGGKDATAPRKVVETYPEPAYEMAQGAIFTEHVLLVSAFADYCEYECDINAINFKSTLMFQTRVYRFSVKNTGKVVLKYTFGFYTDSGQPVDQAYDDCPFSVVPAGGSIEVGEALVVTVRFAPQDVASYNFTLYGMMPNLHKEQKALVIKVSGESLRPFCHFELSDSDYITGERRNPEVSAANGVPVTLEPNTKVVEFGSCGVRVRNTKRFYIVNPTNTTYEFEWTHEAGNDAKVFRCLTPRGIVLSTKKFEMAFEFTPETIELKESLWRFTILGHNLSIPFLLVGQALEPNVFMDRVSVNFKSILVGRQAREVVKLVNNESIPFAFVFNETSFELSPDGTPVLQYSPSSGTVGAHGEVPIDVVFCPSSEKSFNFNLMCNVRKKPTPVGINIKGEGYEIHESLQSELADGSVFELVSSPGDNTIDFGQVQLNEKRLKNVTIINSGRFNFDYSWKFLNKPGGLLSISPEIGTVNKGERAVCEITFLPSSSICLKNVKGICQIVNGRTYTVSITGSGCKPMLKLSKTVHDFGTQFVQRQGLTPASTTVTVTNDDVKEVSYDIIAPDTGVFDIQQGPRTLAPGESSVIEATFYPKEPKKYSEIVTIDVNNLPTMQLELLGEGTEFKIEVLNLENRALNFGAVRVGHVVTRTVKIINRSPIQTLFSLGTPASIEALSANMVTFAHPLNEITLRPKGILNLDLKFYPQQRIPPFSEEVFLEAPGFSRPLFVVMGACQGIEVKLENETLPFGAVVQRSCTTRRIQLQNVGDIGAKFHWDISKLSPDFSVSPHEGYISPSMEIPLEIEFHPTEVNPDIRYENVPCIIEGSAPIYLTLTGMCVSQPLQNEAVKFSSPVRQSDVKSITLTNKTTTPWRIRPIIDNEYWSGPEVFDVEAGQTKSYDVAFTPLDMIGSGDAGRHEGSIFFPLPDGNGMLYKLYGTAERPLPAGTITREVPCKTPYTEVISVTNWLKRPQRFRVVTEVAKADPSVILKGHDFIDVPGLLTKEYKLSFYAYREGITNAKVTFKNEQTQEYLFYNLAFKSTPPGVIGVLELNSVVRQVNSKEITLNNPLNSPVTFTAACPHPEITLPHTFTAQAKSDAVCLVEFLPLLPREATTRLTITSQDLGLYQYDMRLISTVASPERSLHFKVGLGGSQTQIFRFLSYAKSKTEFTCKADSPDFSVEKSVTAPSASGSGVEVSLDVTYEPSKLGDVRTQLVVSSSTGGDYCCSLYGHCIAPRPQGPITIKAGSAASVPFKNVFAQSATFTFVMDNAAFTVKATEAIPAKKTITMAITALPISAQAAASKLPKFGKLTVTHKGSNISWVYYLKSA